MANLLDAIRNNNQPKAPGMTDQSQRVADLLRARSGRAVASPDTTASSLSEQAAVGQAQQQIQQEVAPQAAVQQASLEQQQKGQEQQGQIQQAQIGQERRFNAVENKLKTQQLLNDFERDRGQLDLQKNRAKVQQFAQGLRLQNDKYINDLQREGQSSRLDTDLGFNEAVTKEVFGNSEELLKKQIGNKSILDMSDNEFRRAMGQMDVNHAWQVFNDEKKAAAARAPYETLGNITQAGVSAYGASSNSSKAGSK